MYKKIYNAWVEMVEIPHTDPYTGYMFDSELDDDALDSFYDEIVLIIKKAYPKEYKVLNKNSLLFSVIDEYFANYSAMYPDEINKEFFKDRWDILAKGIKSNKILLGKSLDKVSKYDSYSTWDSYIDLKTGEAISESFKPILKFKKFSRSIRN